MPYSHSKSIRVQLIPTKAVNLRGKYIQQLKELVDLREIGALTVEEYEEHRSAVVNHMQKLN